MKSVSAPLLSLLLVMFGNTYFMSFLAIKMKMDGHDAQAVGNLSSAYFLGFVIGAFIIEKLIERIGHIRSFTLFAALTSALAIAMGLYVSPWFWMLLRLVNGICVAGIYVVVESWLVTLAGKEQRGRALALYMLGLYLAQTLSQQILEYFDPTTLTPFCAMAFLCSISVIPVCMKKVDCPRELGSSYLNIGKTYKASPLGFITCFVSGIVLGQIYGLMPFYFSNLGFSVNHVGEIMSAVFFGALTLQWPFGWISDIVDRRKVLIGLVIGSFIISLTCLIFSQGLSYLSFLGLSYLFGGLLFSLFPLGMSQVCDNLEQKDIVGAMSVLCLVYGTGSFIGPTTSSIVMVYYPNYGFFLFTTIVLAALGIYAISRLILKDSVPLEDQNQSIVVPSTSVHVSDLTSVLGEDYWGSGDSDQDSEKGPEQ